MAMEGGEYKTASGQPAPSTRDCSLPKSEGSRNYFNSADSQDHSDSYRSRCVAIQEANVGRGIERLRQQIRRSWREWAVFRSHYERFDLLTMVRKSLQPTATIKRGKGRTHRLLTICVQDGQDATGRTLITNVHQATAGQTRDQQRILDQLAKLTPGRYGATKYQPAKVLPVSRWREIASFLFERQQAVDNGWTSVESIVIRLTGGGVPGG
eukprot:765968-Hanusia_phi.AAC.8